MSPGGAGPGGGIGEILLFGVRVRVDPMRKCVSMNNLSEYEPTDYPIGAGNEIPKSMAVDGGAGYASADDSIPLPSSGSRERKRGVPWTEEEHKWFLIGLKKVGKGDWRGISKNFVKTRTPTQVASHAQKYFLRQSNANRRRRRSSLFDITTESVTAQPVTGNVNGSVVAVSAPPVVFSIQSVTPLQTAAASSSTMVEVAPAPLSLSLSLSSAQAQFYGFNSRDNSRDNSIVSVS